MTDLDDLPWTNASTPTNNGAKGAKCRRHEWTTITATFFNGVHRDLPPDERHDICSRCGAVRDPVASRRGRTSHTRGNAKERAWCHRLHLEHTGQFKGTADGMDAMFVGQLKTFQTGRYPGWMSDELDKLAKLGTAKTPILGVVEAPSPGHRERRLVVIDEADWLALHVGEKP